MLKIVVFNVLVVAAVVMLHYEMLFRVSRLIPRMGWLPHRFRIVAGVFAALVAHTLEIWLFAVAYWFMELEGWGGFEGNYAGTLMDCVYFSFTTFTTLGFGDVSPLGNIRYLAGIESLTGLVLITWSASFLYYEMQRHWMAR